MTHTATTHTTTTHTATSGDHTPAVLDDVFDEPARWRAASIRRLGLDGEARSAAASPSPAFPQLLDFAVRAIGRTPPGPVVDVGAGLGGVASAIAAATGRLTLALEPSWGSCDEARRLFPDVRVVRSVGSQLPVRDGGAAAVLMSGVVSLLDDAMPSFGEAARVVAPGGCVVVVDLVAARAADLRTGPNRFRALETLECELRAVDLEIVERAVAEVEVARWSELAVEVTRDVVRRHRGEPGFESWLDDHRHVARVLASGRVLMAGVTAVRPAR